MSRKPSVVSARVGGAAAAAASSGLQTSSALTSDMDICPVCGTTRYLNSSLSFLINPECYHPMCTNCVKRYFNEGPNQCPYGGCPKTLRVKGFRPPYFGDLAVEREVDIRRRVAAVFNKQQDDFEDLRAYNDYLTTVEDLTFDLLIPAPGTYVSNARPNAPSLPGIPSAPSPGSRQRRIDAETNLAAYEAAHRAEIESARRAGRESDEKARRRAAAEQEASRRRVDAARREEEQERRDKKRVHDEVLDGLERGNKGDAAGTVRRIVLKKRGQARQDRERDMALLDAAAAAGKNAGREGGADAAAPLNPLLSIRGLKDRGGTSGASRLRSGGGPAADLGPYSPFAGLNRPPTRYAAGPSLLGAMTRDNDWLERAARDAPHKVPGYFADGYAARAVMEAFAGLGVFVDDDDRPPPAAAGGGKAGVAGAALDGGAAEKMDVDDVFGGGG